jgi:hypothetical protein
MDNAWIGSIDNEAKLPVRCARYSNFPETNMT